MRNLQMQWAGRGAKLATSAAGLTIVGSLANILGIGPGPLGTAGVILAGTAASLLSIGVHDAWTSWNKILQHQTPKAFDELTKALVNAYGQSVALLQAEWWKTPVGSKIQREEPDEREAIEGLFCALEDDAEKLIDIVSSGPGGPPVKLDVLLGSARGRAPEAYRQALANYVFGYRDDLITFMHKTLPGQLEGCLWLELTRPENERALSQFHLVLTLASHEWQESTGQKLGSIEEAVKHLTDAVGSARREGIDDEASKQQRVMDNLMDDLKDKDVLNAPFIEERDDRVDVSVAEIRRSVVAARKAFAEPFTRQRLDAIRDACVTLLRESDKEVFLPTRLLRLREAVSTPIAELCDRYNIRARPIVRTVGVQYGERRGARDPMPFKLVPEEVSYTCPFCGSIWTLDLTLAITDLLAIGPLRSHLNDSVRDIVRRAEETSKTTAFVSQVELLIALFEADGMSKRLLGSAGLTLGIANKYVFTQSQHETSLWGRTAIRTVGECIERAWRDAEERGSERHLLAAVLATDDARLAEVFQELGTNAANLLSIATGTSMTT